MESALDVANIFRTEFHTNRAIRITKSSSIFSIIFEWFDRHRFVRSTLALVVLFDVITDGDDSNDNTNSTSYEQHESLMNNYEH